MINRATKVRENFGFISASVFLLILAAFSAGPPDTPQGGMLFCFGGKKYFLNAPMRLGKSSLAQKGGLTRTMVDTMANYYNSKTNYVEIIRQDDATEPHIGLALGFEFDVNNADYPYTPAHAVAQLKNFEWGGVEFSSNDSLNYTGVSNTVSEDLFIEIDRYQHDSIYGRFSGVLISGAGNMALLDSGRFAIKLYKK